MRDLAVAFGVSLRETPREKGATLRLGQGVWVASQLGAGFAPALRAVRGQDALAPGTTPNEGRSEGVPPSN